MLDALADVIRTRDPIVQQIFTPAFQSGTQWVAYIDQHFGARTPSVNRILDKGTNGWSAEDFQALYVACWIFQPVEKGTFMIRLTQAQRANVRAGYETLGLRWTSHLHEHGRSASSGWSFLKGYHELLVQMEGAGKNTPGFDKPFLFLKCEGHTAAHPAHLKSFVTKLLTHQGDTANPALANLARKRQGLGIAARAAENYSGKYDKLLKLLGFSGKVTTARQATVRLWTRCLEYSTGTGSWGTSMTQIVEKICKNAGFTPRVDVGALSNKDLGRFLTSVILPLAENLPRDSSKAKELQKAVQAASADLRDIAKKLSADADVSGDDQNPRFFQEISLDPPVIDSALQALKQQLVLGGAS